MVQAGARSSARSGKLKLSKTLIFVVLALPMLASLVLLLSTSAIHRAPEPPHYRRFDKHHRGGPPRKVSMVSNSSSSEKKKVVKPPPQRSSERRILGSDVDYEIIFSTGCSLFQDWQSYVLFHGALQANQPGRITRIVSGCSPEDEATLTKLFQDQIASMSDRFHIHFTPDYSKQKPGITFKYWNKPFGVRHWLQNHLGFPDHASEKAQDSIVILLDPDQLIVRPFTNNDFSNTDWRFLGKNETPRTSIQHGQPMAQLYGFGLQWKNKINMTQVFDGHSPVDDLTNQQANAGYTVGPPYIATASDMYRIVARWCEFCLPVHSQYPYLLAEMFAYSLGAAHERLAHQTAHSFMVSDVSTGPLMEGWKMVDALTEDEVCRPDLSTDKQPNVIHFCQRYGLGSDYFFGKYRLSRDFISCESPLFAPLPSNLTDYRQARFPGGEERTWTDVKAKRNAYMLCKMIPALNAASEYFKKHHCADAVNGTNWDRNYRWKRDKRHNA